MNALFTVSFHQVRCFALDLVHAFFPDFAPFRVQIIRTESYNLRASFNFDIPQQAFLKKAQSNNTLFKNN
jgi:hypothetical protein